MEVVRFDGVLRFDSEPTAFPLVTIPAGEAARAELIAMDVFRVVRLVLPRCAGLLWVGWHVGLQDMLGANRTIDRGHRAGIAMDRVIELDVAKAYVRNRYESDYDSVPRVLRSEVRVEGVDMGIGQQWGLSFYNPTPAAITYGGASACIKRLL